MLFPWHPPEGADNKYENSSQDKKSTSRNPKPGQYKNTIRRFNQ
jgi:hypothetical protein